MNTFDFNGHQLRTVEIEGEPWFAFGDICRCVGLQAHITSGSYTHHLYKIDKDQTRQATLPASTSCRQPRRQTIVSESAMYAVILRAQRKRPEVAEFQDWVTREVLPSIRKTGGYLLNEAARTTAHADNLMAFGA